MARKDATVFRQRRQGMTAKCPFRPAAVALHCAFSVYTNGYQGLPTTLAG